MTSKDQDRIEAKVDALNSLMSRHFQRFDQAIADGDRDRAETKEWRQDMASRMEKTEVELFFWKTVIKVVKTIVGVVILVMTMKFGEIKGLFK